MLEPNILAENIKYYRRLLNIKQNELASKLYVSPQSVSKWECGVSIPELSKLCEMADIFGVTVDTLIGNSNNELQNRTYIGIDGGGTKTEFVLFEESGAILKQIILEGSNPTSCGIEKTCQILKYGIDAMMEISANVVGIYAGISGADGGDPKRMIPKFLKNAYPQQKTNCRSDMYNVIASTLDFETDLDKCVAVICGTGSVAYICDGGKSERIGGWGYLLDCAGSGYDFGRDVLCAALAERDGLGEKTVITELVEKRLGTTVWDDIGNIYSRKKGYIASFAPIAFEAYKSDDAVAAQIIKKGADRLAVLINRASKNLPNGSTVVMAGGLMAYRDILIDMIKKSVNKNLKFVVPELPQIYGASVLCGKMCGIKNTEFRSVFNIEYKKICDKEL